MVNCFDRNKNKEPKEDTSFYNKSHFSFTEPSTSFSRNSRALGRRLEQTNDKEKKLKKEIFLAEIKNTICLSRKLLEKDTSNFKDKDKEKIIKIHWLINQIIEKINDKIDLMEIYDLSSNIEHSFIKLNRNLMKIFRICNNIYRKYE